MRRLHIVSGLTAMLILSRIGLFLKIFGIMFAEDLFIAFLGAELGMKVELVIYTLVFALVMWFIVERR